jgi:hypothetical protein
MLSFEFNEIVFYHCCVKQKRRFIQREGLYSGDVTLDRYPVPCPSEYHKYISQNVNVIIHYIKINICL